LRKYFKNRGSKNKLKDSWKTKRSVTFFSQQEEVVADLFPLRGKWNSISLKTTIH
jgi:hypothetical protein